MPFLSGKQAFLRILKQEGVELMFGNPGTTELPLMDGLARTIDVVNPHLTLEGLRIACARARRARADGPTDGPTA